MNRIISIIAFALLLCGCKEQVSDEHQTVFSMSDTMMARCEFATASYEQVKNEIRLFGKIEADNDRLSRIHPVLSGIVKSIDVGLGTHVKQGQLLAVLQSSEVAAFQQEKLDAESDIVIAEKNLQVQQDLFAGRLNSEKDVAAAQTELRKARTRLDKINEIHKIYRLNGNSDFRIVAPISGFVISKSININEMLRPDDTEPLFSIAEMNEVLAVAYVNENDIPRIKEGQEVTVSTVAFPDVHHGTIEKIYNIIDPSTKAMKFRVRIPNPDFRLKPEMNCTVTVNSTEEQELITIPSSAVIFDKGRYWTMVFHDRRNIETRELEVYRQLGEITYVKAGLAAGEQVISQNGLLIYDAIND